MLDKFYITPKQWLHILRWFLYALLFLAVMMVQTVVFGNRTLFGIHPDFVPVAIVCICLQEGSERGGIFALAASVFWCLSGADYGPVSIVVLTALPVLGGLICHRFLSNRYLPCLGLSFLTAFVQQSVIFLMKFFFDTMAGSLYFTELLPCVFVSLLAQPLLYLLAGWIGRIGDPYESA